MTDSEMSHSEITVRSALLDDTAAISALFRAPISVWQRIDGRGHVESLPYEALSVYERWTHGGPWMSVETGAVLLSRLLRGIGVPLVAVTENQTVVGYAEAYPGDEPAPFGAHLHLGHLVTTEDREMSAAARDALIRRLLEIASTMPGRRLTVTTTGENDPQTALYRAYGFERLTSAQRYTLPAKTGQSFYKALDYTASGVDQIAGWQMSIGRTESASQHWEVLWPRLWDIIPEMSKHHTHRLHLTASGQEAFLCCQQQIYTPRAADVYCWSPKALTAQLLTAIRDWAHREGYRTLALIVSPDTAKLLGPEAESDPFTRHIYSVTAE